MLVIVSVSDVLYDPAGCAAGIIWERPTPVIAQEQNRSAELEAEAMTMAFTAPSE